MLNQKDTDFDDLFRRASDKYPLRTDSADWDRMSEALDNPSPDMPEEVKKRKRRFLWFFLLFPLGGAGYYIMHMGNGANGAGHVAVVAPVNTGGAMKTGSDKVDGGSGSVAAGNGGFASVVAGSDGKGGTGDAGKATTENGIARTTVNGGKAAAANGGSALVVAGKVGSGEKGGTGGAGSGTADNGIGNGEGIAGTNANKTGAKRNKYTKGKHDHNGGKFGAEDMSFPDQSGGDMANRSARGANPGLINANSRVANYPVDRAGIAKDFHLTVNVEAPAITRDSSKTKASPKKKSSYLYAGLMAAPDLSTVHFQQMKGVGTTFSFLLGYQLNKKWAVETGVSLDRKRYYTDGEYFDTKGVHTGNPTYWKLLNVDGTCYMWELPINIRYNFSENKNSKWFATAGSSTYFMTKENYNYEYYTAYNGNQNSNWNIKSPSQYWFSIINLSAGYEHRLGAIGNLRVEPYLRVPLSGVGTGKLNILSAGLNIGITRRLW